MLRSSSHKRTWGWIPVELTAPSTPPEVDGTGGGIEGGPEETDVLLDGEALLPSPAELSWVS